MVRNSITYMNYKQIVRYNDIKIYIKLTSTWSPGNGKTLVGGSSLGTYL